MRRLNSIHRQKSLSWALRGALAATLALLGACQGHPFTYIGNSDALVVQGTQTLGTSVVDILFVVDNSGSMADKQATLRASSAAFIDELAKTNVNYHLGVVTTDLYAPTDGGRLRMAGDGPRYLVAPSATDPNAAAARQTLVAAFNATVAQLGIGGSSQEAGLGAALTALSSTDANVVANNQGFLRPEADLAIVVVTDEDDCTPLPQNFNTVAGWTGQPARCYDSQQLLTQVPTLVQQFGALKNDLGRVRVALITGGKKLDDGSFVPQGCNTGSDGKPDTSCGCWYYAADAWFCQDLSASFAQACTQVGSCPADTCPKVAVSNVCDTPRCKTTAPHRYTDFLAELGAQRQKLGKPAGTFVDTICQTDYRDALLSVARSIVVSNCISLTPGSDPNKISLSVSHQLNSGVYTSSTVVPHLMGSNAGDCRSCGDCASNAWEAAGSAGAQQICLACGMQALPGDRFEVDAVK